MNPEDLKIRTKKFALRILNLADKLPRGLKGRILSDQIARAGTSTAANYRAACKARSRAEFIAKIGVAEEEADEVQFWLELICEDNILPANRLSELQQEARELTAILAASRKSASGRGRQLAIGNWQLALHLWHVLQFVRRPLVST
jgi:four helix bundle protein